MFALCLAFLLPTISVAWWALRTADTLGTTHWGWTRKGCYNLWHVGQLEDGTIKSLFVFSLSAWWSSSPRIAVPIWASWDGEESIDKAMGQLCGCQLTAAHFNIHRASIAWWKQKPKKSVCQVAAFTADCKPSGVAKEAAVWGPDNAACLTLWLWQRLRGLRFSKASLNSRA